MEFERSIGDMERHGKSQPESTGWLEDPPDISLFYRCVVSSTIPSGIVCRNDRGGTSFLPSLGIHQLIAPRRVFGRFYTVRCESKLP